MAQVSPACHLSTATLMEEPQCEADIVLQMKVSSTSRSNSRST